MINVVVFVVRYFGGKKLGIPGLIEAYSNTSEGLIKNHSLKSWKPTKIIELEYPYTLENSLAILFRNFKADIKKQIFENSIYSVIEINEIDYTNFSNELLKFSSCKIKKS